MVKQGIFKNSEQLNKEALSIPIHPRMSNEDVMKVVKSIKEFHKNKSYEEYWNSSNICI